MAELRVSDLSHEFTDRKGNRLLVLEDVNLEVGFQEFAAVLGPSGCGKSTFLNVIDGLIQPTRGVVIINGREVHSPGLDRAVVFQSPCLLPWRTVRDNVIYGLELRKAKTDEANTKATELLNMVGLSGFGDYYPHALSAGMQQRVNLARALANDPKILLMDEPFAALDGLTREAMGAELIRIWTGTKKTVVFVTHDIREAIYLADKVFVFTARPGKVKAVIEIDIPRPRGLDVKRAQKFLDYEAQIWSLLELPPMR